MLNYIHLFTSQQKQHIDCETEQKMVHLSELKGKDKTEKKSFVDPFHIKSLVISNRSKIWFMMMISFFWISLSFNLFLVNGSYIVSNPKNPKNPKNFEKSKNSEYSKNFWQSQTLIRNLRGGPMEIPREGSYIAFQLIPWLQEVQSHQLFVDFGFLSIFISDNGPSTISLSFQKSPVYPSTFFDLTPLEAIIQPCLSGASSQRPNQPFKLRNGKSGTNTTSNDGIMSFCADTVLSAVVMEAISRQNSDLCLCVHSSTSITRDNTPEKLDRIPDRICFRGFKDKASTLIQYDSRVHQAHLNCRVFEESITQLRRLLQSSSATFFSQNGNLGTIENQNQNGNQVANAIANSNVSQTNGQTQNQDSPSFSVDSTVNESPSSGGGFPQLLGGRLFSVSSCALDNSCTRLAKPLTQTRSLGNFSKEPDWSILDMDDP